MEPTERTQTRPDGTTFTPKLVDGMEYLQQWRRENWNEYDQVLEHQRQAVLQDESEGDANEPEMQADSLSAPDTISEKIANSKEPTR